MEEDEYTPRLHQPHRMSSCDSCFEGETALVEVGNNPDCESLFLCRRCVLEALSLFEGDPDG